MTDGNYNFFTDLPYIIVGILYTPLLGFTIYNFNKIISTFSVENGKNNVIMYYCFIWISGTFRLCDCFILYEEVYKIMILQYMLVFFPSLFMISSLIVFVKFLLNSLCTRFIPSDVKIHKTFESCARIALISYWALEIVLLSTMYICEYKEHECEIWVTKVRFFVIVILYIIIATFTIMVVLIYVKELKLFPATFANSKRITILVIVTMAIQALIRVLNAILYSTDTINRIRKYSKEVNIPYVDIMYALFYFLLDVLSVFSYNLYLKKDSEHLKLANIFDIDPIDRDCRSFCIASIVEDQLVKYLIRRDTKKAEQRLDENLIKME